MAAAEPPVADRVADSESDPSGAVRGSAWRSKLFWGAALVILVLDLWSKQAVFDYLKVDPTQYATIEEFWRQAPRPRERVAGDWLRLVTMLNPGMMWGAFQDYPHVLKLVRPLAVLVIFFLLSSLPAGQRGARLALGAILGGAIGNIWDSFRYLGVRDFVEVYFEGVPLCQPFPAFNVADSAICVGVAVLALGMMRAGKPSSPPTAAS